MKTRVSFILSLALLCWLPLALAQTPPALVTLDAPAGGALPRNFRTAASPFAPTDGPIPSRQGLDGLAISGSGQFSPGQLDALVANLPGRLVLVDLRQESHGELGDVAVSWVVPGNLGNPGLDAAQVAAAEAALLAGIDGQPDLAVTRILKHPEPDEPVLRETPAMGPAFARTEAEDAASRGVGSFRVAVPDRHRPGDAAVDRFLRFYRALAPDVWLHFHCRAGHGRTTTFMLMTDMLRNAGSVSFEDLIARQWLLGGADLRDVSGKGDRAEDAQMRLDFLRRFYDYVRANPGGQPLLWRQWLARDGKP